MMNRAPNSLLAQQAALKLPKENLRITSDENQNRTVSYEPTYPMMKVALNTLQESALQCDLGPMPSSAKTRNPQEKVVPSVFADYHTAQTPTLQESAPQRDLGPKPRNTLTSTPQERAVPSVFVDCRNTQTRSVPPAKVEVESASFRIPSMHERRREKIFKKANPLPLQEKKQDPLPLQEKKDDGSSLYSFKKDNFEVKKEVQEINFNKIDFNATQMKSNSTACCCVRGKQMVRCQTCGHTIKGNVKRRCFRHPHVAYLYDMTACAECGSNNIVEYPLTSESYYHSS